MANNSWEVHRNMFYKADEFITKQNLAITGNALYDVLHQIIWHQGKDPVRWICENNDLVKEICTHQDIGKIPKELLDNIRISLRGMVK